MLAPTLILALMLAQPESGWNFRHRADPGTEDMGILSESLRLMPLDLRIADDWSDLYSLESDNGTLYARRAGAVTAVFPQSNYVNTQFGTVPTVPANTVFVIGEPSPSLLRQLGLAVGERSILSPATNRINSSLSTAIDGRVSTSILPMRMETSLTLPALPGPATDPLAERARAVSEAQAAAQIRRDLSMWYNDDIRRRRVDMLLERALRGED
ncbi:MAG: hypothetical protein KJZ65_09350 [Phycisphaerales bacterium]|nr:hypothetical protein [Phycisphaerales bacterium]